MSALRDLIVSIDFDDIDIKKLLNIDDAMSEIESNFNVMDRDIDGASKEFRRMGDTGANAMDGIADSAGDASKEIDKTAVSADKGKAALDSLKKVGIAAGAAIAGAFSAVAFYSKKAIDDAIAFDTSMREVFTLLPGISDAAMTDMKTQVKDFSKEFGILPEKVVPALYQSLSAGVPKDNVFEFMAVAQKAAVGGVAELATAVDGITSVVNAYGADVVDAAKASDIMFTAVKLGKTNFEELSASLFNVLPNAAAAGVTFEDVAAGVAALTAQGTPTSVATTRMRAAIDELNKSGTGVDKVFRKLAGKSFREFIAEGNNIQDAFQMLEKHAQKSNLQIADLFGSVEAGGAVTALTGKGTEAFTNALNEMAAAAGATDAAFEQMQGPAQAFEKWRANLAVLRLEWGERLLPIVNQFVDMAIDNFPKVEAKIKSAMDVAMDLYDKVSRNWPIVKDTIIGVTAAAGSFVAIMGAMKVITIVTTLLKAYRAGTLATTAAQMGLNTAMLANPAMWVVGGIAALIGIGVLLYRNWDALKDKAGELWSKLIELKDGAVGKLQDKFEDFRGKLDDFKGKIIDVKDNAIETIQTKIQEFTGFLEDNQGAIITTASVLGVVFGPALIKAGAQAAIAGGKIALSFTINLLRAAGQATVTAATITGQFILSLVRSGAQAVVTGTQLTVSLIGTMIRTSAQAIATGAVLTGQFIMTMIKMGAQAVVTSATMAGSMIASMITFAARGWAATAAITGQTAAMVLQKGAMIVATTTMGLMTAAQWALNVALNANPIGLVVLAIGALIAIGVLLYQNWNKIKETAISLWNTTKEKFASIKESILTSMQPVMDFFDRLGAKWDSFKGSITNFKMPKIGLPKWMGGNGLIQGSHATGLAKVPYDGYVAELHKDEAVLTATQSDALRTIGILKDDGNDKPIITLPKPPGDPDNGGGFDFDGFDPSPSQIAPTSSQTNNNTTFAPHIEVNIDNKGGEPVDHGTIAQAVREELEKFWQKMNLVED